MAEYKTGTQLHTLANGLTEGDTLTAVQALMWLNEFLMYLGPEAKILQKQNYPDTISGDVKVLPSDFEEYYRMEMFSDNTYSMSNSQPREVNKSYWDTVGPEELRIKCSGNYRLYYFSSPDELATTKTTGTAEVLAADALTNDVEIDPVFYGAATLWMAYRFLTNDDEDNAKNGSLGRQRLDEYTMAYNGAVAKRRAKFSSSGRIRSEIRR